VLERVLSALRAQTFPDWEAIVVGDACTDDTEAVVAGIGDARFRFVNLARNHGEQSAANNEGLRRARGEIVAFLNHDDFWRIDHLQRALDELARTNADLVYAWTANLLDDGTVVLLGVSPIGRYSPALVVPASSWVLRRSLVDTVGPWKSGWTIRLPPSQEWLWRAHRMGAHIVEVPRLSVVGLPSGARVGSYVEAGAAEHTQWHDEIVTDGDWPEALFTRYIQDQSRGGRIPSASPVTAQLSWALNNALIRTIARVGIHPLALWLTMRHPGRGGFLRWLRQRRGLPPSDT
jgi:glycosyltransferase involved in cell wall biosynthesis